MTARLAALCAALVVALLGITAAADGPGLIAPTEAFARAKAGELLLFDIRRPEEWRQTGVGAPAQPLTLVRESGAEAFYQAVLAAVDGDKARPIAMLCASGNRSGWAQKFLSARGFTAVDSVEAGMFGRDGKPGWLGQGLPVTPCQSC